jgi:phosphate transport system permease protein
MRSRIAEIVFGHAVRIIALLVVLTLALIVFHILQRGLSRLDWEFLLSSPRRGGREGGIAPIIVSTMYVTAIALAVACPLGVGTALLLKEFVSSTSHLVGLIRTCLIVLAATPSIVFGLVGNLLFCEWLGLGFSILAGGLTLSLMVLPIVACFAESAFRGIPEATRLAALALGMPRWRIVMGVLIPLAAPGIFAGLALGLGRAVAESAALIFTSGYVERMPTSLFDSGRTLAVNILDLAMNVPGGDESAYGSATVLLFSTALVIAVLFAIERFSNQRMGVA